ncbi:MAG: HrpB1 family type III secretion system apparatus protein [Pseudomonadota bacterium]
MKSVERPDAVIGGDVYRVLLQIALLGAELGDAQATVQIAEVLEQARPDLPQACAVRAMGYLNLGRRDEAVRELESTLERFPDFQLGKALLGVCMRIGGRTGWQHYLDSVIDDGRDEFAVGMACEIMGRPQDQPVGNIEDAPKPDTNANSTGYAVWA